ncbi:MAG: diguanylate cyclase, partial [Oscillospiraceae bacterium]|nr:diguanylate cyclase [Oscillospiraceae bacterium]
GVFWVLFVCRHMGIKLRPRHYYIMWGIASVGIILVIINFFTPIVFSVDGKNVYARGPLYLLFLVMQFGFLFSGLFIYIYARVRSGKLIFFPVWAFIGPVLLGTGIQSLHYGLSTITPFAAVSLGCINASLQSELIFCDKLTGLYNRFYLNFIEKKQLRRNRDRMYTAVMMDINDFKSINDEFGHLIGDCAIVEMAKILERVVGVTGEVIRYAGDEFILILNAQDDETAVRTIANVNEELERFNTSGEQGYKLSVSVGHLRFAFGDQTVDELFGMIDKLMYENKEAFYRENAQCDRRRKE